MSLCDFRDINSIVTRTQRPLAFAISTVEVARTERLLFGQFSRDIREQNRGVDAQDFVTIHLKLTGMAKMVVYDLLFPAEDSLPSLKESLA
jgi:hypothetical protein